MKNIIIIPMLPIAMRYSDWWNRRFQDELQKLMAPRGFNVVCPFVPLKGYSEFSSSEQFMAHQLDFEMDWLNYLHHQVLNKDDIVLVLDCATPGLIGSYLHTRKPCKFVGFCHGTSFNALDIFPMSRRPFDAAVLSAFDKVLVASQYHKGKLLDMCDTEIVVHNMGGLPDIQLNPAFLNNICKPFSQREAAIAIVDRPTAQKRDMSLLMKVADHLLKHPINGVTYHVDDIHGKATSWEEYFKLLASYRFILVTAQEETYGYQVHDAMQVGTFPIAPLNMLSYYESIPPECQYVVDGTEKHTHRNIVSTITSVVKDVTNHRFTHPVKAENEEAVMKFFPNLAKVLEEVSMQ